MKQAESSSGVLLDRRLSKILTVEASGMRQPGIAAQYFQHVPVVFAKKQEASNLSDQVYASNVFSFTKNKNYVIRVDKKYLSAADTVLIIDDFLANGNAALGLIDLVNQAGAQVAGVGIVIEKGFQSGRQLLEERGYRVESLAIVKEIKEGAVILSDQVVQEDILLYKLFSDMEELKKRIREQGETDE